MLKRIGIIVLYILFIASLASAQQLQIRIKSPENNQLVPERTLVQGTVTDPNARVWVVIHPMLVNDYWIQPQVSPPAEDGTWEVYVYIGRPGEIDTGKPYEIMAFANPVDRLQEGQYHQPNWPSAQARSQVIKVTRR